MKVKKLIEILYDKAEDFSDESQVVFIGKFSDVEKPIAGVGIDYNATDEDGKPAPSIVIYTD